LADGRPAARGEVIAIMNPSPIRLLVVEDNPADALLLKHALSEAGAASFHVTQVEQMADAERCLAGGDFDAILLDLSLPDSRGVETVRRANVMAPQLPIVVMTGLDDEATALEAVRTGAQDFLIKGNGDGRLLARAIRYAMERKQTEQELKALNETLEQRVAERTATATRRATQLQALASELMFTEQRERRRLAEVLHDQLQQLIYAARLNLGALRSRVLDADSQEFVRKIDDLLAQSLDQSRSLTIELSPPVLYEAGLAAALEWLGRHFEQTCGLVVDVQADSQAGEHSSQTNVKTYTGEKRFVDSAGRVEKFNSKFRRK
jgi:ribosomal protein L31